MTDQDIRYEPVKDGVKYERNVPATGDTFTFLAKGLNMDYKRPHATVYVGLNKRILAYSYLSLAKDEDRVRLANSAWNQLPDESLFGEAYPKQILKHDLDLFCAGAFEAWVGNQVAEEMEGEVEPSALARVIDPYMVDGGGTILFGPPGGGKSWITYLMAVAVDAGLAHPWKTLKRKVLFVNIERSKYLVQRRLGRVNKALGLEPDRPLLTLNARGRSLRDIRDAVERTIEQHQVEALFLDSISRAGYGKLTADDTANAVIDDLNNLCPTWFGIAHAPRGDATHAFGSIHFDAGADITVRLASEQRGEIVGVHLSVEKVNDGKRGFKQMLALEMDEYGLSDVRFSDKSEFTELAMMLEGVNAGGSGETVTQQVVRGLSELGGEATASAISDLDWMHADRTYISRLMNQSSLFVSKRVGRETIYTLAGVTPKRDSEVNDDDIDTNNLPF